MDNPLLKAIGREVSPMTWVCCGARNEDPLSLFEALPAVRFIGFEPEATECRRLQQGANPNCTFYPVAVGGRAETRCFYVTRNPSCSSLLKPDPYFFGRFQGCAEGLTVDSVLKVETVDLQTYLPTVGVTHVDFLEVDTQGADLDILHGAESLLKSSVIGIKVEVEFSRIYEEQPLFSDVDAYLRGLGFVLFDITRNRYRRQNYPVELNTRGQLMWGDSIYLKDYQKITGAEQVQSKLKLVIAASYHGFHDYALEVIDDLLIRGVCNLDARQVDIIKQARADYIKWLRPVKKGKWVTVCARLRKSMLRKPMEYIGMLCQRLAWVYNSSAESMKQPNSWAD